MQIKFIFVVQETDLIISKFTVLFFCRTDTSIPVCNLVPKYEKKYESPLSILSSVIHRCYPYYAKFELQMFSCNINLYLKGIFFFLIE